MLSFFPEIPCYAGELVLTSQRAWYTEAWGQVNHLMFEYLLLWVPAVVLQWDGEVIVGPHRQRQMQL